MLELMLKLNETRKEKFTETKLKPLCNFNLNEVRFSEQTDRIKTFDECRILAYVEFQPHRA